MIATNLHRAALLGAACLISACAQLESLATATAPVDLFTLTPKSTFDPGLPPIAEQIVVQEPTATSVVSSDRIMVQPSPLQVQYLPGVRWVDRAPLIVQSLLIESFENSGRVPAVGRSQIGLRADYIIVPDLREFQARVAEGAQPTDMLEVHVRLNIKVVDARSDMIIGSESFEELGVAGSSATEAVVAAFDQALGDAMRDAVEWSVRTIHAHAGRVSRQF